ncbi:MAG: SprT family zinc-dependent metalloprotease [Pseudomonadota bacterium]
MSDKIFLPGTPPVIVEIRSSVRARRLSLRVSRLDGRVTLTVPKGVKRCDAETFARSKAAWLRRHLARQVPAEIPDFTSVLPIEGVACVILPAKGRRVILEAGTLQVPPGKGSPARQVEGFLKTRARDRLAEASDRHAAALGRSYGRITLRDTRSRWGSCTVKGDLMYSWRLIMAPPVVLDYVTAHEVSHLAHMDHSPRFWATVRKLCPEYEQPRAWLRHNGTELHRWRFRLTERPSDRSLDSC